MRAGWPSTLPFVLALDAAPSPKSPTPSFGGRDDLPEGQDFRRPGSFAVLRLGLGGVPPGGYSSAKARSPHLGEQEIPGGLQATIGPIR
jgi:hypothetical protein